LPNTNALALYIVYMRYSLLLLIPAIWLAACNQTPKSNKHDNPSAAVTDSSSNSTQKPVTADKLIVPGKSIGQATIDENSADVIKRLGKPDGGDAAMGKSVSIWYANHDTTGYQTMIYASRQMGTADETSRVKQIKITSPWFTTADSVHAGSTLQQIRQHYQVKKAAYYNKGNQQYTIYGTTQGIAFEVDPQDKCVAVIVYEPDSQASGVYLPFYSNLKVVE